MYCEPFVLNVVKAGISICNLGSTSQIFKRLHVFFLFLFSFSYVFLLICQEETGCVGECLILTQFYILVSSSQTLRFVLSLVFPHHWLPGKFSKLKLFPDFFILGMRVRHWIIIIERESWQFPIQLHQNLAFIFKIPQHFIDLTHFITFHLFLRQLL